MKRMIDADKLIEALLNPPLHCSLGGMSLEDVIALIDEQPIVAEYTECKDGMPPESYNKDWEKYASDSVMVIIENAGGGTTTYEYGYDYTIDGKWLDGDGTSGRTTIAWRFEEGDGDEDD